MAEAVPFVRQPPLDFPSCVHCGGHDGVMKLMKIHPGLKFAKTPGPVVYGILKCRNSECRGENFLVPRR